MAVDVAKTTTDAATDASGGAVTEVKTAAGDSSAVALAGAPTVGDDLVALDLIALARAGSQAAGGALFPQDPKSLWPGYHLHELPVVLAPMSSNYKVVRTYLLGFANPPPQATPVPGKPGVLRYDAAIKLLDDDEDTTIAGNSALTVRYMAADIVDHNRFIEKVAEHAMSRLIHYEAKWDQPSACGANTYPRGVQTLALWFLECAVVQEALVAQDTPTVMLRLREWYAIRLTYADLNEMLGRMNLHYDNVMAAGRLVALRVVRNSGRISPSQYNQTLAQWLAAPMTVPPESFDEHFVNDGTVRAAALEVAFRLGWELEPVYRKAQTAFSLVPSKSGSAPGKELVEVAKLRHDFAKMLARAQVLTPPEP